MTTNLDQQGKGRTVLGIDLGTTSIKVCIVKDAKILATCSKPTEATLDCPAEQDVLKIIQTLENCISSLPQDVLENVEYVGICGQMHGVCLWKNKFKLPNCSKGNGSRCNENDFSINNQPSIFQNYIDSDSNYISNLYTWMDQRCDAKFLSSIPVPDSNLRLSTGHGCATLFWLNRNTPEIISKYDYAGTVMDFLVAVLCNLGKPVISNQNAASWGYFNCETNTWNLDIMEEANFPIRLLPEICHSDVKLVGKLANKWLGIKVGTPIGPALGDLQCAVFSTFLQKHSAFINISTSAQIAHLSSKLPEILNEKLEYFPYFRGQYLAVGASLNGGNVLAAFVDSLIKFAREMGTPEIPKEFIWNKLLSSGENVPSTNLLITPTLFGERHNPEGKLSIENVSPFNISIGHMNRAIIKGLVHNLSSFMGIENFKNAGITQIVASGSALLRNPIFQEELKKAYFPQCEVQFTESDSSYGAALYFA